METLAILLVLLLIGGILFLLLKLIPETRPAQHFEQPSLQEISQNGDLNALASQLPFPLTEVHLVARESPASIAAAFRFEPRIKSMSQTGLEKVDPKTSRHSIVPLLRPKEPWWPPALRAGRVTQLIENEGYQLFRPSGGDAEAQTPGWWLLLRPETGHGYAWY